MTLSLVSLHQAQIACRLFRIQRYGLMKELDGLLSIALYKMGIPQGCVAL
jgi:hypothetical protein